jgi:hypothetical protein
MRILTFEHFIGATTFKFPFKLDNLCMFTWWDSGTENVDFKYETLRAQNLNRSRATI